MSPIGRIFLVLNLILSAVFLGWASNVLSTSQDYKTQLDERQAEWDAEREDLDSKLSAARVELNASTSGLADVSTARDQFKADLERVTAELAGEKRTSGNLQASVSNFESQLGTFVGRLDDIESSKDRAVSEARAAEAAAVEAKSAQEAAEMARRDAEERMAQLENLVADLRKEVTSAKRDLSSADAQLAAMVSTYGPLVGTATAKIDARITGVESSLNLVMLNVGESQGVTRGMKFDVYAGSVYKGKVSVLNADDNQCSAKIVTQPEGAVMAQGDNATTLL